MMLYTQEDGTSAACTGTLLNDGDPTTHIPYFLTAHHCVPDQVRASSIETYWHLSDTNRSSGPKGLSRRN
jgi:hypothetical protein